MALNLVSLQYYRFMVENKSQNKMPTVLIAVVDDHVYTATFIAQELEQIYPELVQHNDSLNCKTINYLELIPLIICKMQKMQTQIDELLNSKN